MQFVSAISRRTGILLAVFMMSITSVAQAPQQLFVEASPPTNLVRAEVKYDTVVRSRVVTTNPEAFPTATRTPGSIVPMNFFTGNEVDVVLSRLNRRSDSDYTWIGYVAGEGDGGSVTLVVKDDVLVGNVRSEKQGYFQIRRSESGVMELREIDEALFPGCDTDASDAINAPPLADDRIRFAPRDTSDIFDVMVVYTPAARIAAGGTVAMEALITLAVAETNTAYTESLINSQARLVHQEEVAYTEVDSSTDLSRFAGTVDGFMDNVHTLRDTYGADLVSLFADYAGSTCGRAYVMTTLSSGFAASAFGVVSYNCATGYYSFAHEMAHNMGSTHALPESTQGSALYNYSMGWRWNSDAQRSIMAYSPGTRVDRFSNPDVLYNGFPTGQTLGQPDEANNALSINNAANTIANWRTAVTSATVSPETDLNSVGPGDGSFSPDSETYTILNASGSSVDWTATKTESWITLSSAGGTLGSGLSTDVIVSINSGANALAIGNYSDTVTFTDTTNSAVFQRTVNLVVTSPYLTTTTYDSNDVPKAIVNASSITSTLVVADSNSILDINVSLDITHAWDDDLDVTLESPTGTIVELFTDVGSSGNNFTDTTLDDEAGSMIANASAPFTGTFQPEGLLANFDTEDSAGTWTLHITDDTGKDAGTLNSWSIDIEFDNPGPTDVVYVDLNNSGFENGSSESPWNDLMNALSIVDAGGTINLVGDSAVTSSAEVFSGAESIDQDVTIDAVNGTVSIGEVP